MPIVGSFAGASSRAYGLQAGLAIGDFESIATVTAGSAVPNIEFTNIPQNYTHLQIRGIGITSVADRSFWIQFNADTTSNYSAHYLQGNGSTVTASYVLSTYMFAASGPNSTTYPGAFVLDVLDYTNTNKHKTIMSISGGDMNGAGGYASFFSGSWRSTNAVTSIKILPNTGNFSQYSSFALYGIKA